MKQEPEVPACLHPFEEAIEEGDLNRDRFQIGLWLKGSNPVYSCHWSQQIFHFVTNRFDQARQFFSPLWNSEVSLKEAQQDDLLEDLAGTVLHDMNTCGMFPITVWAPAWWVVLPFMSGSVNLWLASALAPWWEEALFHTAITFCSRGEATPSQPNWDSIFCVGSSKSKGLP